MAHRCQWYCVYISRQYEYSYESFEPKFCFYAFKTSVHFTCRKHLVAAAERATGVNIVQSTCKLGEMYRCETIARLYPRQLTIALQCLRKFKLHLLLSWKVQYTEPWSLFTHTSGEYQKAGFPVLMGVWARILATHDLFALEKSLFNGFWKKNVGRREAQIASHTCTGCVKRSVNMSCPAGEKDSANRTILVVLWMVCLYFVANIFFFLCIFSWLPLLISPLPPLPPHTPRLKHLRQWRPVSQRTQTFISVLEVALLWSSFSLLFFTWGDVARGYIHGYLHTHTVVLERALFIQQNHVIRYMS